MIRVICFFILLAVISSTAVASETDWSIIFRASSSSFDGFGPLALCGTRTSSIDGLDRMISPIQQAQVHRLVWRYIKLPGQEIHRFTVKITVRC